MGEGVDRKGGGERVREKPLEGSQDPAMGPGEFCTLPGWRNRWEGRENDLDELSLKCTWDTQTKSFLRSGLAGEILGLLL